MEIAGYLTASVNPGLLKSHPKPSLTAVKYDKFRYTVDYFVTLLYCKCGDINYISRAISKARLFTSFVSLSIVPVQMKFLVSIVFVYISVEKCQ